MEGYHVLSSTSSQKETRAYAESTPVIDLVCILVNLVNTIQRGWKEMISEQDLKGKVALVTCVVHSVDSHMNM
jgi:hypothetical protein